MDLQSAVRYGRKQALVCKILSKVIKTNSIFRVHSDPGCFDFLLSYTFTSDYYIPLVVLGDSFENSIELLGDDYFKHLHTEAEKYRRLPEFVIPHESIPDRRPDLIFLGCKWTWSSAVDRFCRSDKKDYYTRKLNKIAGLWSNLC